MKTAFFASDAIAIDSMRFLKDEDSLSCVVSNPDRPKGRGNKVSPNEAAAWAIQNGIEVLRPEKSPDDDIIMRMSELGVECIVVMAYGKFLKDKILAFPKRGCLNLHASLLPKYRGASPVETAIALGDTETGVSLMKVTHEMDAGPVADFARVKIDSTDTAKILRGKLCTLSAELLKRNFEAIENGELHFADQDAGKASYCRKLSKADASLDFRRDASELCNRIRAFGFGSFIANSIPIKIGSAVCESSSMATLDKPVGTVLCSDSKAGLKILCGNNSVLNALEIQKPCAKMMMAQEALKSFSIEVGSILESAECSPLIK